MNINIIHWYTMCNWNYEIKRKFNKNQNNKEIHPIENECCIQNSIQFNLVIERPVLANASYT
ncbi:hypothetical protein DERF_000012 [Dermatophagoides farinae]|uniref:Uncharacterized protein n=1 Tax=Dermatophagoides farinae TaxID=6954 RepID=A0A922L7V0_DERFA|nr:hypothetical protein DERF_000012 [Dermatophagoides farinae]